ncbi:MAG: PGPGW domain-containing protein [Candidatus Hydrogenedentes bacterium]|nr:PGPGW domain-containing protein [Candidatus Hydrogenedentota bacterium]
MRPVVHTPWSADGKTAAAVAVMAYIFSFSASYIVKNIRKILIFFVGITVLISGVAMLLLPGPGTVVIPLGLALLGTEFIWARRLLKYMLDKARSAIQHFLRRKAKGN